MPTLEQVLADRVRQLRLERGWSQSYLAYVARRMGLKWTPGVVGLVETGGQRADRLVDVATLCWIFDVGIDELLEGDGLIDLPNGDQAALSMIRNALMGQVQREIRHPPAVMRHGSDDPDELARIGKRLDLDASELRAASWAVFKDPRFLRVRDQRAGINASMPARTAQARRGHATRAMLAQIEAAFAKEGREALISRAREEQQGIVDQAMADRGHLLSQRRLQEKDK